MKKLFALLMALTLLLGGGFDLNLQDAPCDHLYEHTIDCGHEHASNSPAVETRSRLNALISGSVARAEAVTGASARSVTLLDTQSNDVSLYRGDGLPTGAAAGMRVIGGDTIASGSGSVFFQIDGDKLFELEPNSAVTITQVGESELVLTLTAGGMYFHIANPLKDNETLEMNAGTTTMSIRGTDGYICFSDGEVVVTINKGKVVMKIGDKEYEVGTNQRLTAHQLNDDETIEEYEVTVEDIAEETSADKEHIQQFLTWIDTNICTCGKAHMRLGCTHFPCGGGVHTACAHCGALLCDGATHGLDKCAFNCAYCGAKDVAIGKKSSHGLDKCAFNCAVCGVNHIAMSKKSEHGAGLCVFDCPDCGKTGISSAKKSSHGMNKCVFNCADCGLAKLPIAQKGNHGMDKCVFDCVDCGLTKLPIADKAKHGGAACRFDCVVCGESGIAKADQAKHGAGTCGFICTVCGTAYANGTNHVAANCVHCGTAYCPSLGHQSITLRSCLYCDENEWTCSPLSKTEHGKGICGDECGICGLFYPNSEANLHGTGTGQCGTVCPACNLIMPRASAHAHTICQYCNRASCSIAVHVTEVSNCATCGASYRTCTEGSQHGIGAGKCGKHCDLCGQDYLNANASQHKYVCDKCKQTVCSPHGHVSWMCQECFGQIDDWQVHTCPNPCATCGSKSILIDHGAGEGKCGKHCDVCGDDYVNADAAKHGQSCAEVISPGMGQSLICNQKKCEGIAHTHVYTCSECGATDVQGEAGELVGTHGSERCVKTCSFCRTNYVVATQSGQHGDGVCGALCDLCKDYYPLGEANEHNQQCTPNPVIISLPGLSDVSLTCSNTPYCGAYTHSYTCSLCGTGGLTNTSGHGHGLCVDCLLCGGKNAGGNATDHGLNTCAKECPVCGDILSMTDYANHGVGTCEFGCGTYGCATRPAAHIAWDCEYCGTNLPDCRPDIQANHGETQCAEVCSICQKPYKLAEKNNHGEDQCQPPV